jgi:N-acylneuraminate cytidylyltransferase
MRIAIIPARGGSKRIPRKNVREFHGKPIIAYSIETALKSKLFDIVMVSTDDQEIADLAKSIGAEVPFLRSTKNSDDFATTSDVLAEVIQYYKEQGTDLMNVCCLYPTSPLINDNDLKEAHNKFNEGEFDVLMSSVEYSFPIQRAFHLNGSNEIQLIQPEYIHSRSQDLKSSFHDAGAFYFFRVDPFMQHRTLWQGRIGAFVMPESKVQDIDCLEDWKIAEAKYTKL